jgi:lipoprotein-anchoring transpeptidase ErfK/SrfK
VGAFQDSSTTFRASRRFSRNAMHAAMIAIAGVAWTAPGHAAVFWSDEDPMRMSPEPLLSPPPRPKKVIKRPAVRPEKQVSENAKPVGPLVIAISIDQQRLKVYDANGLFAESPVSTGMKGHTTPMGAFSVIQKNKYHKSNIYSGAPMPYMQRITWSGIAMHAGMLPGYPASHGCIRMPMAFATKMWGWTRMGARVVITPGEISPAPFAHPLLATRKPDPAPVPMAAVDAPTVKAELPAAVEARPAMSSASLELKPAIDSNSSRSMSEAKRERGQSQTADASGAIMPQVGTAIRSDVTATAGPNDRILVTRRDVDADAARAVELAMAEVRAEVAIPAEAQSAATKPLDMALPAVEAVKPDMPKDDAAKTLAPSATVAEATPKRTGQIAVLISRKDGKMYVRQNYAPLFEVPVTVSASDRPLGTHVFTARVDKSDTKSFHWSVVSMPAARVAARADEDDNRTRRRRSTGAVEMTPTPLPDGPAEALDRLTIPAEAMAQLAESLASGSSIIVSDLGIAAGGETGQGTEFVVPLR